MSLKKISAAFSLIVILGLFGFSETAIGIDPRCFTRDACQKLRGDLGAEDMLDGFYNKPDAQAACGVKETGQNAAQKDIGFCLPVGQSVTKISFGGRRSFANLGEFIKYGYQYGMWLAGIIAVAMLVIAGVQWAASGGNSDMIGSAKNRITGALTGLVLLALSYTILASVNPYLVQLRLPQTWLINSIALSPPFCSLASSNIAYLSPDGVNNMTEEEKQTVLTQAESEPNGYPINPQTDLTAKTPETSPICGNRYIVEGTNGQTCLGELCPSGGTCVPFTEPKNLSQAVSQGQYAIQASDLIRTSTCWDKNLIIKYSVNNLFENLLVQGSGNTLGNILEQDSGGSLDNSDDWFQDNGLGSDLDNKIWIYPVCKIAPPPESQKDKYNPGIGADKILTTLESNPFVIDKDSSYIETTPIILIIKRPNNFREYLVRYPITNQIIEQLRNRCGFSDSQGSFRIYAQLIGIVIKNQININWTWTASDALIYTYKKEGIEAGSWIWNRTKLDFDFQDAYSDFYYLFPKGFIPIADIDGSTGKGLYLELDLEAETISNLGSAITDIFSD